ncbi:unnamed protein product [Effrenium voratum]|nr:unnamed protein product [Effrenium voratum]
MRWEEALSNQAPPVVSLTLALRGASWRRALQCLRLGRLARIRADTVLLGACAAACGKVRCQATLDLVAGLPSQPLASSGVALNVAAQASPWQRARQLLGAFGSHLRLDEVSISASLRSGWADACRLLQGCRQSALETNVVLCSLALDPLGPWLLASALLRGWQSSGLRLDLVAYGGAISAVGAAWKEAWALLHLLRPRTLAPNAICTTAALSGAGGWPWAAEMLQAMGRWSLRLDPAAFAAAGGGSTWAAPLGLLTELGQRSLASSLANVNLALTSFRTAWPSCLALAQSRQLGELDEVSRGALAAALATGYDWVKALWLLRSPPRSSPSATEATTNAALSALARAQRWRRAVQVLAGGHALDGVGFDMGVAACQNWLQSLQLLDWTGLSRFAPCTEALSSALGACAREVAWRQALRLALELPHADAAALERAKLQRSCRASWPAPTLQVCSIEVGLGCADDALSKKSCAGTGSNTAAVFTDRLVNLSSVEKDAELQARKLTEDDVLVLEAEAVLAKALKRLESGQPAQAKELRESEVFQDVLRYTELFDSARATLQPTRFKKVWSRPDAEFYVRSAPGASWFEYKIVAQIEQSLVNCMAPLHERELILKYQPVFVEPHRDLLPPRPHHALVRTLARIMGFYIETVFELLRISNRDFGFLVEIAKSDFPVKGELKLPRRPFWSKRIEVDTKNLWLPRGGNETGTIVVSVSRVQVGVPIPSSALRFLGNSFVKSILGNIKRGCALSSDESSPWNKRIKRDADGFYRELATVEDAAKNRRSLSVSELPGEDIFDRPWRLTS